MNKGGVLQSDLDRTCCGHKEYMPEALSGREWVKSGRGLLWSLRFPTDAPTVVTPTDLPDVPGRSVDETNRAIPTCMIFGSICLGRSSSLARVALAVPADGVLGPDDSPWSLTICGQ